MATAVATKPSAPHQQQKMKRPPPPAVQTNGIQNSRTSPSPSTASKRIPSASSFKAPPTPTLNGVGNNINGTGSRLSNRRRDSQRPGDPSGRMRGGKDGDRKNTKKRTEPYVKDQAYILRKYKDVPPSLTLHLHSTLFRFDQQDGSFSYNSPMKVILEHIKSQSIPHDILEDLHACGVKFYESCLIVQIKDHRHAKGQGKTTSSDVDSKDYTKPFSIHNYSTFVTPSSYVDFPEEKNGADQSSGGKETAPAEKSADPPKDKQKGNDAEPKTYTVVLFPTSLSIAEEVMIQANTPDMRPGNRKQNHNVPRTPASATVPHTPLSAVPSTPLTSGPPAKKQKMSITGSEVLDFESRLIAANAAPLYLEPAQDIHEFQQILDKLTDALHRKELPAPKSRKRTVAELAADEAQAASDQAFMLIMDERLGPAISANAAKAGNTDEAGTATFEPSFEKFNAIQSIKLRHEQMAREKAMQEVEAKRLKERHDAAERMRHEADQQAQAQAQAQAAQAQANAARMQEMQRRQENQRQEIQRRQQAMAIAQAQAQAQNQANNNAMNHNNVSHAHANGGMLPNGVSQPQHSSPVVRHDTPRSNPSPSLGNSAVTQPGGVSMNVTSSGQGGPSSSPTRPSSAMQQNSNAPGMVRQGSRPQMISRTGTPMMNGTPNMSHTTPAMGHATPVTSIPQGSPPAMQTPVMNTSNGMGNSQMLANPGNGRPPLDPQTLAQLQRRQAAMIQHQQQQHQAQLNSPNQQISPERRQAMQQQFFQQQRLAQAQQHAANAMNQGGAHGHPQMPNGVSPHGQAGLQQGHPGQQPHPQQMHQNRPMNPMQQRQIQIVQQQIFNKELENVARLRYGGNANLLTTEDRATATHNASQGFSTFMARERSKFQNQQQMLRQQQQMMANPHTMQGQNMATRAAVGGGGQVLNQQQLMAQMAQMGGGGMPNMNGMPGMNPMGNGMGNGMNMQ